MSDRVSSVEKSLTIMLLRARETVMMRFRPLLKAYELSEQQWRVMRVLKEQGPSEPTILARESVILTPSLTRILTNLEARGLVSRARHEKDGRRQVASLTGAGEKLIAEIAPQSAEIYAGIEKDFGPGETSALMAALRALSRINGA